MNSDKHSEKGMWMRPCAAHRIESLEAEVSALALVHTCLYLAVRRERRYGSLV
jgi:hypothetical protein